MTFRKRDCGQAAVLTVMFMVVLLGMAAAVLDVGHWYRDDRRLQATVDAAALAGAQALPSRPGEANALANSYSNKNGGGLAAVKITSTKISNDTIEVTGARPSQGFFTSLFGIDSVTVHAAAKARTYGLGQAKWVAPIVVNEKHPNLNCTPNPCQTPTQLDYYQLKKTGSQTDGAGNFGFINLSGATGVGASTMEDWILNGYDQYMGLGPYDATTGNEFTSTQIEDALLSMVGDVLLFPIYRKITGGGTNAKYEIVGWVGFRLSGVNFKSGNRKIFGSFTEVIWDGIEAVSPSQAGIAAGVRGVSLVE